MRQDGSLLALALSFYICTVYAGADIFNIRYIKTREGNDLFIDCNISTSNNVTVFWSKNGTSSSFTQSGGRLNLVNIKPNNAGYYTCYSFDTLLPEHNGTAVNKTMDVVSIAVQNAEKVVKSSSRPYELMKNDEAVSDNGSDGERTQMIVVLTLSSVGTVSVIIFIVYLIKYRLPRRLIYDIAAP